MLINLTRFPLVVLACIATVGCAMPRKLPEGLASSPTTEEMSKAPSGACPLWIYRNQTSFQSLTLPIDLPVAYVNDVAVGKLRVGATHCANVKPGRYLVTVREPNIFFMNHRGDLQVEVKEGASTYVRWSKQFGGFQVVGTAVAANANVLIREVSEEDWKERR